MAKLKGLGRAGLSYHLSDDLDNCKIIELNKHFP